MCRGQSKSCLLHAEIEIAQQEVRLTTVDMLLCRPCLVALVTHATKISSKPKKQDLSERRRRPSSSPRLSIPRLAIIITISKDKEQLSHPRQRSFDTQGTSKYSYDFSVLKPAQRQSAQRQSAQPEQMMCLGGLRPTDNSILMH